MESIEDFSKIIHDCFAIKYDGETSTHYIFKLKANLNGEFKDWVSTLEKNVFAKFLEENYKFTNKVNSIEKIGYFECLIKNDRATYGVEMEKEYVCDNISYEIGIPSIQLLLNSLFDISKRLGISSRNMFFENFNRNGEFFSQELTEYCTFEQVRNLSKKIRSVKVISSNIDNGILKSLSQSLLYELNSSMGEAYSLVEMSIYDLFRSNQHHGPIRVRNNNISIPVKIYDEAILSYYQRAISTNNVEFQFLSFYQILEFFYDRCFGDKMSAKLLANHNANEIDMSDNDSRKMVIENIIRNYRKLNEIDSLKLVLKTNITSKTDFKTQVNKIDDSLLKYLKNPWPGFLDFESLDYDLLSLENILVVLAERIYSIRNEVAHRKSKRTIYIPQKHERYLLNETRLIQIIAEIVIANSGKDTLINKM